MKNQLSKFTLQLTAFTIIISLAAAILFFFVLPDSFYTPTFPFLVLFFFSVTFVVFLIIVRGMKKKPSKFINIFMLTTFIKLFFLLLIIVVYALVNRDDAIRFIVTFFALYLFYTGFEVISILRSKPAK